MNSFVSRLFQMFANSPQPTVQDTFITFLQLASRQVAHGFVIANKVGVGEDIEVIEFQMTRPELMYDLTDQTMLRISEYLKELGWELQTVGSYQYNVTRDYLQFKQI